METQEEFNHLKYNIMYKATRQLEFNPVDHPGELIVEISETIPGQALSIQEVLYKFTNGTLGNIGQPTYYDFEEEIETFKTKIYDDDVYNSYNPLLSPDFDLTDAEEYQRIQKELEAHLREQRVKELNEPKAKGDKENLKQENQTEEEES